MVVDIREIRSAERAATMRERERCLAILGEQRMILEPSVLVDQIVAAIRADPTEDNQR